MITENLSTLKIHKLTQAQYDRELAAGNLDPSAIYLTPDVEGDLSTKISAPYTAAVGQTIVVKAVNENGKPTEWECVDPWVITSSTEGSTKQFKITVDDTGALTLTEIV